MLIKEVQRFINKLDRLNEWSNFKHKIGYSYNTVDELLLS